MLDDRAKAKLAPQRGSRGAFRTMMSDGLDRSTPFGKLALAYRYAVLVVGLSLAVPVALWLIAHYPTSRFEHQSVDVVRSMAVPIIAAVLSSRTYVVRRAIARIRARIGACGTIRRR